MYNNIFTAVSNVTVNNEKLTEVVDYDLGNRLTFFYDNDKRVDVDPNTDNIIIYSHKEIGGLERNIIGENYNTLTKEEKIKCLSEEERILLLDYAKHMRKVDRNRSDVKPCSML